MFPSGLVPNFSVHIARGGGSDPRTLHETKNEALSLGGQSDMGLSALCVQVRQPAVLPWGPSAPLRKGETDTKLSRIMQKAVLETSASSAPFSTPASHNTLLQPQPPVTSSPSPRI